MGARIDFAQARGLVSYGTNFHEPYRRAAAYVDSILGGGHADELPVEQPTRFGPVLNIRTARDWTSIPPSLLARADEGDRLEADNLRSSVAIACLGPLWVRGCPIDYAGSTTGVHHIADDLLHRASRQSRAISGLMRCSKSPARITSDAAFSHSQGQKRRNGVDRRLR